MGWRPKWLGRYLGNVAVWLSEGLNTLRGGSPQETTSGVLGRAKDSKRGGLGRVIAREVSRGLDHIEPGHTDATEAHEQELLDAGKRRPGAFEKD